MQERITTTETNPSLISVATLVLWNNLFLNAEICMLSGLSSVTLALCPCGETRSDWLRCAAAPRKAGDATRSVRQCATAAGARRRRAGSQRCWTAEVTLKNFLTGDNFGSARCKLSVMSWQHVVKAPSPPPLPPLPSPPPQTRPPRE